MRCVASFAILASLVVSAQGSRIRDRKNTAEWGGIKRHAKDFIDSFQTPSPTFPHDPTAIHDADALINEFNDPNIGVAFSMVDLKAWKSTKWGVLKAPQEYTDWAQTYVSIATHLTDMNVYRGRSFGLALHVDSEHDFWKYFQVDGRKSHHPNIVGGPGDGGSHTPPGAKSRLSPESQGKGYEWFSEQKHGILTKYNTVYHIHDYNEFITNGLSASSISGVFHNIDSHEPGPSDADMCNFLIWTVHTGKWPIYAYSHGTLKIERYLECDESMRRA